MLIGSAMTKRTRLQTANQSCQNSAEDGLNSTTAVTIERTTTGKWCCILLQKNC